MSRLPTLPADLAESERLLPGVDAERCVHTHLEQASCRACVDACPAHAWVIDDTMLGIDSSKCDGCGLCAPVCPERAIEPLCRPLLLQTAKTKLALAICDRAAESCREPGWVPCLHAIGVDDLLRLRQQGVGALLVSRGDCADCSRGSVARLAARLEHANRLLRSRGATRLGCRELDSRLWRRTRRRLNGAAPRPALLRRAFFDTVMKHLSERVAGAETTVPVSPDLLLPESGDNEKQTVLYSCLPVIDRMRCTGCDACIRICPHAALTLADDGGSYRIRAARCTGCSMCVDLCEPGAVRVVQLVVSPQQSLPLVAGQCRACGIRFHVPATPAETPGSDAAGSPASSALCTICSRHNHHDRLFQVLDA